MTGCGPAVARISTLALPGIRCAFLNCTPQVVHIALLVPLGRARLCIVLTVCDIVVRASILSFQDDVGIVVRKAVVGKWQRWDRRSLGRRQSVAHADALSPLGALRHLVHAIIEVDFAVAWVAVAAIGYAIILGHKDAFLGVGELAVTGPILALQPMPCRVATCYVLTLATRDFLVCLWWSGSRDG